jgi:hypothetical protein
MPAMGSLFQGFALMYSSLSLCFPVQPLMLRAGFVDRDLLLTDQRSIQCLYRGPRLLIIRHFNEGEAA